MGQMLNRLVERKERCLIATDGRCLIAVALRNAKTLNYNYYMKRGDALYEWRNLGVSNQGAVSTKTM